MRGEEEVARYQFHVLSFEGPDPYASAGGIAIRVTGLASAIADCGFDVHLWFVGDPEQPGHGTRGRLHLHRWCQWISAYHPGGVYDGEEKKREDLARSLPPYLFKEVLLPHLAEEETQAVVLAEEWQTVDAILHLDWLLRSAGLRQRVRMLWNANNTFGFDRIDWPRLTAAAMTTTVSRYMRFEMIRAGVDPLIIPNGLPRDAFYRPRPSAVRAFHSLFDGRLVLAKVARWDPAKRWLLAVDTTAELKRRGAQPLLIARGGAEAHGSEVRQRAASAGLKLLERSLPAAGEEGLLRGLQDVDDADIVVLDSPLDSEAKKLLFHASAAVLAHSGHEPFGLVGLETMAVAGVACTGLTGEDYAVAGLERATPTAIRSTRLRAPVAAPSSGARRRSARSGTTGWQRPRDSAGLESSPASFSRTWASTFRADPRPTQDSRRCHDQHRCSRAAGIRRGSDSRDGHIPSTAISPIGTGRSTAERHAARTHSWFATRSCAPSMRSG